ncbi:MAG TPA: hypothetical protein PKV98_05900 [Burkholderiaceae bacterium]|nr:hypothetical protein [Burkholderiaceae bacterium]
MPKLSSRLGRAALNVLLFIVLPLATYLGWRLWEQDQLENFCAATRPGLQLAALPALVESYGFNRASVERQLQQKGSEQPVIYVSTLTSIGQTTCTIRHDGAVVTSATMDYW